MKLSSIFSTKKTESAIKAIDRLLNTVDGSVQVFREGVKNYLYADSEAFKSNLASMAALESEAGALRREIETYLYSRGSLLRSRGDIMRLLERIDHIIGIISSDLIQFEIETPKIPSVLRKEFVKLSELAAMAVESCIPGAKAYFESPGAVSEEIDKVYFYDKEATKLAQGIQRTVFHDMNELKLSEKFHLRYFALHIEDLSNAAMKVAEQLSVMNIKRNL